MEWSKLVPELAVSDFEVSLDFYTQVLGFQIAFSRSEPAFAYLDRDGIQLMLEEAPPGWLVAEMVKPFGRGINFEINWANVTQLRDKFVQLSYPLYRDIKETWRNTGNTVSGSREFLVQDPDGYLLRFSESIGEREKD